MHDVEGLFGKTGLLWNIDKYAGRKKTSTGRKLNWPNRHKVLEGVLLTHGPLGSADLGWGVGGGPSEGLARPPPLLQVSRRSWRQWDGEGRQGSGGMEQIRVERHGSGREVSVFGGGGDRQFTQARGGELHEDPDQVG